MHCSCCCGDVECLHSTNDILLHTVHRDSVPQCTFMIFANSTNDILLHTEICIDNCDCDLNICCVLSSAHECEQVTLSRVLCALITVCAVLHSVHIAQLSGR